MKNTVPYNNNPEQKSGYRVYPGLLLEVYGPTHSSTVQLTPDTALALAQSLLFDARETLRRPELMTFNATEARHREALQRAELTFNATEARHQAEAAAGKAL